MKSDRNPIPIDSSRRKQTPTKASARHPAMEKGKKAAAAKTEKKSGASSRSRASHTAGKSAERATASPRTRSARGEKKAAPAPPPRLPENHHPNLHEHSYAAHLDGGPREPHPKPAGLLRFGTFPMARKQP